MSKGTMDEIVMKVEDLYYNPMLKEEKLVTFYAADGGNHWIPDDNGGLSTKFEIPESKANWIRNAYDNWNDAQEYLNDLAYEIHTKNKEKEKNANKTMQ